MFFISPKKLFLFSRYSHFCNFFPSIPHFPDSKEQVEVEQFMMSWIDLYKFADMIFGKTQRLLYIMGLVRKKKVGALSPLAFFYPRWVVSYGWSKNNILASLCLASNLAVNWLQKFETKDYVYYAEVISVLMCVFVCMVSQFDLSITKQNYLFVRCQSLSYIPNTSLRCSNQPLWKLTWWRG